MGARIQLRRGRASQWEQANPVLRSGEPGFETDTKLLKVGDGTTPWVDLPYSTGGEFGGTIPELEDHVNDSSPHPAYDDGPSLVLIYNSAKV